MENLFTLTTTMEEVEKRYPFARPLLHGRFHVGGCVTCGYNSEDSIAFVAKKHGKDVNEMLEALNEGLQNLSQAEISIKDLVELQKRNARFLLLDVREQWEFELARIPGAILLTEENLPQMTVRAREVECVVVVFPPGLRSMNAVLYLRENGMPNARSLRGGVEVYSQEVDASVPRY